RGMTVTNWYHAIEINMIDGTEDGAAKVTVQISRLDGRFDLGIIDGVLNLTGRVIYAVGGWLRTVQTGYIRSYVLFLVLAAIAIFAILSYFVAMAVAG